jgi:hypothetical protein
MTQNTRAELLRQLIAQEDEYGYDIGSGIPSEVLPKTTAAMKLFLERLHAHEVRIGKYHTDCYLCKTADEMIKEFK